MDNFFARSAGKQTRSSFEGGMDLFANHQFGFATGASATAHKLHHPQRNYAICFECQQHQELIIYYPLHGKQKDREWFLACDIVPRI